VSGPPSADSVNANWLAQGPPSSDDRGDRPAPPPRDGFDRPAPPRGEEAFPRLRERFEQLRRIQEQLRELANESMPDRETLSRVARQMDEALGPPMQGLREGAMQQWEEAIRQWRGSMDRDGDRPERRGDGPERHGEGAMQQWEEAMRQWRGSMDRDGDGPERRGDGPERRGDGRMPKEMRPTLEAGAQARMVRAHLEFVEQVQRLVSNPMQATIVAVRSIVDVSKDNPKQGIGALQPLLDQEQTVATRTVIRMGLRDLYDKAGDSQGAIEQLAAVVKENAAAMKEHEQRRPASPPPAER
jgi:hypothetical protein